MAFLDSDAHNMSARVALKHAMYGALDHPYALTLMACGAGGITAHHHVIAAEMSRLWKELVAMVSVAFDMDDDAILLECHHLHGECERVETSMYIGYQEIFDKSKGPERHWREWMYDWVEDQMNLRDTENCTAILFCFVDKQVKLAYAPNGDHSLIYFSWDYTNSKFKRRMSSWSMPEPRERIVEWLI